MNKSNNIVLILTILLVSILIISCNKSNSVINMNSHNTHINPANDITPEPKEKFTIGWSVYNLTQEFFRIMQDGVLAKANDLGIDIIAKNQEDSTVNMITGVTDLINQGIDALVISPVNPEAMVIISDLTKKAGIPLIVVDIGTGGADVDAFIITDNYGGGVLAGEYALRLLREHGIESNNVAIIKVEDTATYARRRGEAFEKVMTDSGYNIVAEATANSKQQQAYEAMKEILLNYGDDLAVVFAENDPMAIGAALAIDEAGKRGEIMVIGFNGDPSAIDAITEGLMQGTIAQQPFEMGALGVETANSLLEGNTVNYDDRQTKEMYVEVYLIDENGKVNKKLLPNIIQ